MSELDLTKKLRIISPSHSTRERPSGKRPDDLGFICSTFRECGAQIDDITDYSLQAQADKPNTRYFRMYLPERIASPNQRVFHFAATPYPMPPGYTRHGHIPLHVDPGRYRKLGKAADMILQHRQPGGNATG